jgi:hypothetical protein
MATQFEQWFGASARARRTRRRAAIVAGIVAVPLALSVTVLLYHPHDTGPRAGDRADGQGEERDIALAKAAAGTNDESPAALMPAPAAALRPSVDPEAVETVDFRPGVPLGETDIPVVASVDPTGPVRELPQRKADPPIDGSWSQTAAVAFSAASAGPSASVTAAPDPGRVMSALVQPAVGGGLTPPGATLPGVSPRTPLPAVPGTPMTPTSAVIPAATGPAGTVPVATSPIVNPAAVPSAITPVVSTTPLAPAPAPAVPSPVIIPAAAPAPVAPIASVLPAAPSPVPMAFASPATAAPSAAPRPGSSPANPIMPVGTAPDGALRLPVPGGKAWSFFDPILAIGYNYELRPTDPAQDLTFGITDIRAVTKVGDGKYQLFLFDVGADQFVDVHQEIDADPNGDFNVVQFLQSLSPAQDAEFGVTDPSDGLTRFSLRGIDPSAGLDPNDPDAFITGLQFTGTIDGNLFITPLLIDTATGAPPDVAPEAREVQLAVSEPATLALMSGGLLLLGPVRRRANR